MDAESQHSLYTPHMFVFQAVGRNTPRHLLQKAVDTSTDSANGELQKHPSGAVRIYDESEIPQTIQHLKIFKRHTLKTSSCWGIMCNSCGGTLEEVTRSGRQQLSLNTRAKPAIASTEGVSESMYTNHRTAENDQKVIHTQSLNRDRCYTTAGYHMTKVTPIKTIGCSWGKTYLNISYHGAE